jgi:hypothetical protein
MWLSADMTCNGVQADWEIGTVGFQGLGLPATQYDSVWYAFTPDCNGARGAVVFGPSGGANVGNTVNIINFNFPPEISDGPGSTVSLDSAAYDQNQFRVSADGSYLIAVSADGAGYHASLWNMLELFQVNPPVQYSIAATLNPAVAGDKVEGRPSSGGQFDWPLP